MRDCASLSAKAFGHVVWPITRYLCKVLSQTRQECAIDTEAICEAWNWHFFEVALETEVMSSWRRALSLVWISGSVRQRAQESEGRTVCSLQTRGFG
jgi:hypothetical protein